MAKAFLKRISPARPRSKPIDWPFPVEGETPRVTMLVLGQALIEQAYFATMDHFKARKPAVGVNDIAFAARERAEVVFRAFRDADGQPLDKDVDDLVEELGKDAITELYNTWSQFQADSTAAPATAAEMDALVEYLKKSGDAARLSVLSSSTLIALITTLANRLETSTPANEHGS